MIDSALPDVSRETLERLGAFSALVKKWTVRINLISKGSTDEMWERHILDSAQLFDLAPKEGNWVDLGSGGGFPAIVICILSQGAGANNCMTMVESDQRKAVFLRTALRELDLAGTVVSERIENIDPLNADILSARALADLPSLLGFAERHLLPTGVALFPKGAHWEKEQQSARNLWSYTSEVRKSITNSDAVVLKIEDIARV